MRTTLPSWASELRPHQIIAIQQVLEQFHDGTDVVFLDAPTGSGKTLIGELVRQELSARGIYLCSSISLQEQFHRDFPEAAILKGRSNYPTLNDPSKYRPSNPSLSLSCADCNKRKSGGVWNCAWCSEVRLCPYEQAKATALRSPLVCSNSYYFLYETNYIGTLSGRDLVIVDEADTLESVLMSFISVNISERQIKDYGLPKPERKTVASTWAPWAEECYGRLLDTQRNQQESMFPDLAAIKARKRLDNLVSSFERLVDKEFGVSNGGWVYDGYKDNRIEFKPITVAPYAKEYLWNKGKKWLMMSATIISQREIASSLGL